MDKKEKKDGNINNNVSVKNVKNNVDINPTLNEKEGTTAIITFGRFNPVTIGHQKLVDKIVSTAKKNNATPMVFLSHSNDVKKNPLSYDDKLMIAKKAFGNIVQKSNAKTLIDVLKNLSGKYENIILVVGQDRVKEFETLINKYNQKEYSFDSLSVISAGDRDPDSEDVTGMSASKMRKAASDNDYDSFVKGLPAKLKSMADDIFDMVRSGMQLAEEVELLSEAALTIQQRKQRGRTMRRFKAKIAAARRRLRKRKASPEKLKNRAQKQARNTIKKKLAGGKQYSEMTPSEKMVVDKKLEKRQAMIKRIATRLLPKVRRAEMERLKNINSPKTESINYEELTAKELKKRENHFEKTSKMSPNNPDAYREVPTDKDIQTKLSVHTKRYHQMFTKENSVKFDKRFKFCKKNAYVTEEQLNEVQKFGKKVAEVNGYHIHDLGPNYPYKDKRFLAYMNSYIAISYSAPTFKEIEKRSNELKKSTTLKHSEHDDWKEDMKVRIATGEFRRKNSYK